MTDPVPLIDAMLRRHVAPTIDGLYRRGAPPLTVEYHNSELPWFEIGPPLDFDPGELEEMDEDDEFDLDTVWHTVLPDGGSLRVGEEAHHGSFGFFSREDATGAVVWAVVMTDSNPFVEARVDGPVATFVNNLGNEVTLRLDDPVFGA